VTVTEYVPAVVTVKVLLVVLSFHLYVAPGVVEEAVRVALVTAQVRVGGGAILTFGNVLF
jgi:hypothetical protein